MNREGLLMLLWDSLGLDRGTAVGHDNGVTPGR
jgi:hypothetical protein